MMLLQFKIYTVVGVNLNTIMMNFLWFLTSFFQLTSLQVNKEKLLIDSFYLFACLCLSACWWNLGRDQNFNSKLFSLNWYRRRQNIFLSILLDDEGFYVFGHDHVGHGKSDGRRKIINISISLN